MPCMVHGHGLRAPPRAKKFDFLLWPPYGIGQAIIFLSRGFFFYLLIFCLHFSSPILSRRRLDVCIYFHTWCGLSANLECRSEMCCMRIAENTGRKKSQKIRHPPTIAQMCRAISSQLRHMSTIGKKLLNSNIPSTCLYNMANFGPLAAEIGSLVWAPQLISTGFASWQRFCTAI